MSEDTMTEDRPIDVGDLHAALTPRWSWQSNDQHAARVEASRDRARVKAEAQITLARTIVENDLPWPTVEQYVWNRPEEVVATCTYHTDDIDTFRLCARAVRRAVGGLQTKSNEDGSLTATVIREGVAWDVQLTPEASPCEQVQVGTETKVVREETRPAAYIEVAREQPVYEWKCPPSVLDEDLLAEAEAAIEEEPEPSFHGFPGDPAGPPPSTDEG